jgi:hypothetical protein
MKERTTSVQTSLLAIANKTKSDSDHSSLAAEASVHEEPDTGKPHAGICAGLSGYWQSYRDSRCPLLLVAHMKTGVLFTHREVTGLPNFEVWAQAQRQ